MSRNDKTMDVKGFFSWVYSLFGIWWFVVVSALITFCVVGSFGTILLGVLCVASFIMWIKTGENRTDKAKGILNSIVSHMKDWWAKRPSLTK